MIKLKNLIKEVTANSVAYFAYRTKVKKVEPAIFDSFKRLMKYKENDKFQYFNMNPKKRLGVYQVIKKAVPISSTKLSSAEKKKYQEVMKQLKDAGTIPQGGKSVTHIMRVKKLDD
tara:strand:+ start:407 stop:754 length:348 start_codon:yes stop_codon:yes gene_type:complete